MKKLIYAAVVLALAGAGGYWYYASQKEKNAKQPEPTAVAETGAILEAVESDGKVVSNLDVEIKCKASGEIIKLPYDISDTVKKGDLLLVLDPVDELRNIRQTEASLKAAQAKLESSKLSLAQQEKTLANDILKTDTAILTARAKRDDQKSKSARLKELLNLKLASREESETAELGAVTAENDLKTAELKKEDLLVEEKAIEAARQSVKAAEAQVEIERLALEIARQKYSDTSVVSPMDGIVTARNVQVGQIISSPLSNVGGGTTVLTISDLSRIFVLATVDEADISRIALGQTARVTVDAHPGKTFMGNVVRISPRGVNVSNVVTFEVKIEIVSPNKVLLRPEMTSRAQVEIHKKDSALLVPSDSIVRKSGKYYVSIKKADETQEERAVETGITDGRMTEITKGLNAGETVITKKSGDESKWQGQAGDKKQQNPPMMRFR